MKFNLPALALPVLAVCGPVIAQIQPNAGSLNQQIEREQLPKPVQPPVQIRNESVSPPAAPTVDNQKILVKGLRISGAKIYSETELAGLTRFNGPREQTLSELRGMAAKITDHYRKQGYFLAQAYVPAQDIKDGILTIAVLEGQYGNITLRNSSNLSNDVANDLLAGLNGGEAVAIAPLENRLLLLSDLPGVQVKSTLVPGASVGVSDLIVEVTPGLRLSYSLDADNEGNRYTGSRRVGGSLTVNNPTGHGDALSLRVQTSGDGFNYGRASYQAQLGRAKAGVAVSSMRYHLGEEFDNLNAHGTAQTATVFGSYPLVRSRNSNLSLQMAYELKAFKDRVDATAAIADKNARVWTAGLAGDARDGWGGWNRYAINLTAGRIDIRTPAALAVDAATARSNGQYEKLSFQASRLQGVTNTVSLYAAVTGQTSSKNLDTSEKMGLGGATGVRAYPAGEAYGDQGYILNLEARMLLPRFADGMPGQMQLVGFVDTGTVILNKTPWSTGKNRRTLSGAGLGLNWVEANDFMLNAYFAHRLGSEKVTSAPDDKSRFVLQGIKQF